MIFARNRKVGSFGDIDADPARLENPTLNPRLLPQNRQHREREFRGRR